MQLTVRAGGAATAAEGWDRYADLDRWPEWAPQISGVDAPGRRLRPGLRGTVRALGVVHVPFTVLAVDERARTWSWQVSVGPARLQLHHGVEPAEPSGCRTWLTIDGPSWLVVPYAPAALVALHSLVLDR